MAILNDDIPLITIADVERFNKISKNFNQERFDSWVSEVQRKNLRELLTPPLYFAFFDDFVAGAPQDQRFIDLLDGLNYNDGSDDIVYFGLKPFIIYHWLAVNAMRGDTFHADYGNVNYVNDPQRNMQMAKGIQGLVKNYQETSVLYRNNITKFIDDKNADYQEWEGGRFKERSDFTSFIV